MTDNVLIWICLVFSVCMLNSCAWRKSTKSAIIFCCESNSCDTYWYLCNDVSARIGGYYEYVLTYCLYSRLTDNVLIWICLVFSVCVLNSCGWRKSTKSATIFCCKSNSRDIYIYIYIDICVVMWVQELWVLWVYVNMPFIFSYDRKHINLNMFIIFCLYIEFTCMTNINKISYNLLLWI